MEARIIVVVYVVVAAVEHVVLMHGITLGGTGKKVRDKYPRLGG